MPEDEDEAEDNLSRPRTKFWPRGQSGLEDLTSLMRTGKLLIICRLFYLHLHSTGADNSLASCFSVVM